MWPQYGHDPQHTFNSQVPVLTANTTLSVSWEAYVGSEHSRVLVGVSQGKPAIITVSKPDRGGELVGNSYDLEAGKNLWTHPLGILANENLFDAALDPAHLFVAALYLKNDGSTWLSVTCAAIDDALTGWTWQTVLEPGFYVRVVGRDELSVAVTLTASALIVTASFDMFAFDLSGEGGAGKVLWHIKPPSLPSPFSPPCSSGVNSSSTFNGPASFDATTGSFIISTGFFSDVCYYPRPPPPGEYHGTMAPSVLWVSSTGAIVSSVVLSSVDVFSVNASGCFIDRDCLWALASPVTVDAQGKVYVDTVSNGLVALRGTGTGSPATLWNYTGSDWVIPYPGAPLHLPVVDGSEAGPSGVFLMKFTGGQASHAPQPSIVRVSLDGHLVSAASHALLSTLAQLVFFPASMALFYPPSNLCFGVASSDGTLDSHWSWDRIPGGSTTVMVGPSPRLVSIFHFKVHLLGPSSGAIGIVEIILISCTSFFVLVAMGIGLWRVVKQRWGALPNPTAVPADPDNLAEPLIDNPTLN